MLKEATPPASVPVPSVVGPSLKIIMPVPVLGVSVAVKVTVVPKAGAVGEVISARVEVTVAMVTVIALLVAGSWVLSPA